MNEIYEIMGRWRDGEKGVNEMERRRGRGRKKTRKKGGGRAGGGRVRGEEVQKEEESCKREGKCEKTNFGENQAKYTFIFSIYEEKRGKSIIGADDLS